MRDYLVNSEQSKNIYIQKINELWERGKTEEKYRYMTFPPPKLGEDRSISQNSLFHVWLNEYAGHLAGIDVKQVQPVMIEMVKKKVKEMYYLETGEEFMIIRGVDPFNLKRRIRTWSSSASWKTGEMYRVLCWFQVLAANDGLVLEVKGEFAKNKRMENN